MAKQRNEVQQHPRVGPNVHGVGARTTLKVAQVLARADVQALVRKWQGVQVEIDRLELDDNFSSTPFVEGRLMFSDGTGDTVDNVPAVEDLVRWLAKGRDPVAIRAVLDLELGPDLRRVHKSISHARSDARLLKEAEERRAIRLREQCWHELQEKLAEIVALSDAADGGELVSRVTALANEAIVRHVLES